MKSIAPAPQSVNVTTYATLSVRFPEPVQDYEPEMVRAYRVSGLAAAELARAAIIAGTDADLVLGVVTDAVRTALPLSSEAEAMLAEAVTLLSGAPLTREALSGLWAAADSALTDGNVDTMFTGLVLGYALDVATGRVEARDGVVELARWVATLVPFVDADGMPSARGKLLASALRVLSTVPRCHDRTPPTAQLPA